MYKVNCKSEQHVRFTLYVLDVVDIMVDIYVMKEMKNQNRDFELEAIVSNLLISQYQVHILKSRIADRSYEWWIPSQDRDLNSLLSHSIVKKKNSRFH